MENANNILSEFQQDFYNYAFLCSQANNELETTIKNMQEEMRMRAKDRQNEYNIIRSFAPREKTFESTFKKLSKRNWPMNMNSIRNLHDIYGTRILTLYRDDIEKVANMLRNHDTLVVLEEKDYVNQPKPNGYSSYHMIIGVKVKAAGSTKECVIPLEVQIRTMAMNIWGESDHITNYKQDDFNPEVIQANKELADTIITLDNTLMRIRDLRGARAAESFLAGFIDSLGPLAELE